jgi:DNA polymerase V
MILLVDCNNFFVSCEETFNPKIKGKASVVLSSNDGCVIARSAKAKALGIPMGIPFFKIKKLVSRHRINVFSANFDLYADISKRVMITLKSFGFNLEIYSIDEAFVFIPDKKDYMEIAYEISARIKQWCGISVSIGIAKTKTLAKLANYHAKNFSKNNITAIINTNEQKWIDFFYDTSVAHIWGIGKKGSLKLNKNGVYTVFDFLNTNNLLIENILGINGIKIPNELKNIPSLQTNNINVPKSLIVSRSFRKKITSYSELRESVATFANTISKKLHSKNLVASFVYVRIFTTDSRKKQPEKTLHGKLPLYKTTNNARLIIDASIKILNKIYKNNLEYTKSMVAVYGIYPSHAIPQTLPMFSDPEIDSQYRDLNKIIYKINSKAKNDVIKYAVMGINPNWTPKAKMKSPKYTTDWKDILKVKI